MNSNRAFREFINAAMCDRLGVAAWFLPGQERLNMLVSEQYEIEIIGTIPDISNRKGFVFAPFQNNPHHPIVLLRPGKIFSGTDIFHQLPAEPELPGFVTNQPEYRETTREEHLANCRAIIGKIKKGDAEKVVLSRIKKMTGNKHPAEMLLQMKSCYPGAFCYLFSAPQTGLWLGATPETLFAEEDGLVKTMALAGTRPHRSKSGTKRPWGEKELQEQQFVTDFIAGEIEKLGINHIEISEPVTVKAGNIEHIRTDIAVNLHDEGISSGKIITALHPTPAVCGLPRDAALRIIRETENHERAYYTGFLGPLNLHRETSLFVNLRCMQWADDSLTIFAGGGITAASVPEDEWDETEMKTGVMEKVISGK